MRDKNTPPNGNEVCIARRQMLRLPALLGGIAVTLLAVSSCAGPRGAVRRTSRRTTRRVVRRRT